MSFQPTVRKRSLRGPNLHGRRVRHLSDGSSLVDYYNSRGDGIQITESEGHPFHHKYDGRDVGGSFRTLKETVDVSTGSHHLEPLIKGKSYTSYDGTLSSIAIGQLKSLGLLQMPKSLEFASDLDKRGTEAVNLCNPLNPVGDATTFLTESIHERIPSLPGVRLWKGRTKALLGIADEFLNAEFGWMPMLREIGDFAKAVKQAGDIMQQYERDAGRLVRRKWDFPIENSTTAKLIGTESVPWFGGQIQTPGQLFGFQDPAEMPLGQVVEIKQVQRKLWFRGSFTYPVPDQSDAWSKLVDAASGRNAANVAFGSTITPETLWEIAPWSWALDWVSNAQEVVSNLQLFEVEGLVMPYGYMMDETITTRNYVWETLNAVSHPVSLTVSPVVVTTVKKTRKQANPFGFGLEWSGLSPTKLAILAALGITLAL